MPAPSDVPGRHAGLPGHWVAEDGPLRRHLAAEHRPVIWAQHRIVLLSGGGQLATPALRANIAVLLLLQRSYAVHTAEGHKRLSLFECAPAYG